VNITESLKIAVKCIKSNWMRSLLTMLGIIIGISSVIMIIGAGTGVRDYIVGLIEDMGSNAVLVSVDATSATDNDYITLDEGSAAGIRPEMGVVDANGVVGIVYKTSLHYSTVIPLLNSKSSISCKIVGSDYFGYLKWEYGDSRFAYLKDLPRHAEFNLGDTVVTSGYSTVFPAGVMVGTVDDMSDSHDGLSYLLKIKLATDFGKVGNVRVIARTGQEEQKLLEKEGEK